ncbi:PBECR4 domain-containing protein [Veillonella intestinalis]|uniref:PBECR4 domain-containing protein n=1 Tax=Veillonella intestinalis TaxID=2941341 RepID=UPI00203D913A|nr:PBECR4 domain-containing protein [Veillonella intestinalis]
MSSFKENIRRKLIVGANIYANNFLNQEYLIYSRLFKYKKYYILTAKEDNFLHLTGVTGNLEPKNFFEKCLTETLSVDDFEIFSKQQKGSVRRKVAVLESACQMFSQELVMAEEYFEKNKIRCVLASSDGGCTLGFTDTRIHVPQTLLKGNVLKYPVPIEAILSRKTGEERFENIIFKRDDVELQEIFSI